MAYWAIDTNAGSPLDAKHRWLMPGMKCTVCRHVWAGDAQALPSVNLEGNPADGRLRMRPYPEPLANWLHLASQIRPAVPLSEPIHPGLDFGPLQGRSEVPFRVTWYPIFGIILSEEVREEFASLAPEIPLVRADLQCDNLPPTYEIEFRSYGAELIEEITDHCDACGYYQSLTYDPKDFRIRNIPDVPLFTLRNRGLMIAHDRLIPFFERELGPTLNLSPIQVEQ